VKPGTPGFTFEMVQVGPSFTARAIAPERADAAYPLARIAAPHLAIEGWRRLVARIGTGAPTSPLGLGILVAEDPHGYIHGLGIFHPAVDLDHGCTVLEAELVVPALFDPCPVAVALLEQLRAEAERCVCPAIRIHLPAPDAAWSGHAHALAAALAGAGYDATAPVMRWRLTLPQCDGTPVA
jgi:hypothetical protein